MCVCIHLIFLGKIAQEELEQQQRAVQRQARPPRAPRLGPQRAAERAPAVLCTDELVGSLRELKVGKGREIKKER